MANKNGICTILCLATIVVMFIMFISVNATDWCNLEACTWNNKKHTYCLYPSPYPSENCVNYKYDPFTDEEKHSIVTLHNELRQKVASGQETRGNPGPQPPAVFMPNLEWDDELADIAQRWTNQCIIGHDECNNTPRFFSVAQNAGASAADNEYATKFLLTFQQVIMGWYDEVAKFDNKKASSYDDSESHLTGHYVNLVGGKTTKIGCGRMTFTNYGNLQYSDFYQKIVSLFICNYAPSEIFANKPIYEIKQ